MKAIFNTCHSSYKTVDRLNYYRKQAADFQAKQPAYTHYHNWRAHVRNLWSTANNTRGEKGEMFTDTVDQIGEYIGDYWEVNRGIDNTGWFSTNWQDETIKGGVCKLRTSKGVFYIPVVYYSDSDGTIHYLNDMEKVDKGAEESEHETAAGEAARSANYYSEKIAEEFREQYAIEKAEQDILEARETIHAINKKALSLLAEIKKHGAFSPAVCTALREKLADYLRERRAKFRTIEKRENDYWSAVY